MSILTYITEAQIKDSKVELDGKILTKPTLIVSDGTWVTYAVDVDIGIVNTTGYDQTLDLANVPYVGTVLHNVPIARNNNALIYADIGSAVRLRRSASGIYEVIGYSAEMPGTNVRIAVDVEEGVISAVEDLTLTVRRITFGELITFGGFGTVPFGSTATYIGSTFIRLN